MVSSAASATANLAVAVLLPECRLTSQAAGLPTSATSAATTVTTMHTWINGSVGLASHPLRSAYTATRMAPTAATSPAASIDRLRVSGDSPGVSAERAARALAKGFIFGEAAGSFTGPDQPET